MPLSRSAALRTRRVSEERGAALVFVVLFMPIALVLAVLAIDVANWFVHERHLQTQADAAALAAVQEIQATCSPQAVIDQAQIYAGLKTDPVTGLTYNVQVGGTLPANIHELLNSATYYNQSNVPASPDGTNTDPPCTANAVDVKLTETNLPSYLPFNPVSFINAHARAQLRTRTVASAEFPLGVTDATPQEVHVWLVDEDNACGGAPCVIADGPLHNDGGGNWSDSGTGNRLSAAFKASTGSHTSVVVALSGAPPGTLDPAPPGTKPTLSQACQIALVTCYDKGTGSTPPKSGLAFIQTYPNDGPATITGTPIVRSVQLANQSCNTPDPYFGLPCTAPGNAQTMVSLTAAVDFGTGSSDPTTGSTGAAVTATVGSPTAGGGSSYSLTYNATTGLWQTPANGPIPISGAGPNKIYLSWTWETGTRQIGGTATPCTTTGNNPCKNISFGVVQRSFLADATRSGPIQSVQISAPVDTPPITPYGADSFARCPTGTIDFTSCTHSLQVNLSIAAGASLTNDTPGGAAPPENLRAANGAQTGAVACDPTAANSRAINVSEIAYGCSQSFKIFDGVAPWDKGCPSPSSQLTLPTYPYPWECAATSQGATPQDVGEGLNQRVICSQLPAPCQPKTVNTCPLASQNKWTTGTISASDPRLVTLFVLPYGSFGGTPGSTTYPIQKFGTFYITAWQGANGVNNPCESASVPVTYQDDPPNAQAGEIWGHFLHYNSPVNLGSGGACDPAAFGDCVAVLTQ